jgi:hypothetical protein
LAMNGESLDILLNAFDARGHLGNGMNLYAYEGANPVSALDALGLEWGLDDETDDLIADRTGNALYALGAINEGAKWASIGLRTALSIGRSFLPGSGLYDAFKAVEVIASGKGGFWEALDIVTVALPVVKWGMHGLAGLRGVWKAKNFLSRACNCFVAGTPVETPDGPKPIETLQVGDEVLTVDQAKPGAAVRVGRVTRVFQNLAPVLAWLTLSTGDVLGTTPGHEVWTVEDGWTFVWRVHAGDRLLDEAGQPVVITDLQFDAGSTPVYNIEVDGTYTYFARGVWVHNNSCSLAAKLALDAHHVFPKFLAGLDNGFTVLLPHNLHQAFHGGLLSRLARDGIHKPRNMKWAEFLGKDFELEARAWNSLANYTEEFDRANGTSLLRLLLDNMQ